MRPLDRYEALRALIIRRTVLTPEDCWIWMGPKNKGYGRVTIRISGVNRTLYSHRVAWEAFHNRRIPKNRVVAHAIKCLSPLCCNPGHLRATTQSSNNRDKHRAKKWREKNLSPTTLHPPLNSINAS